MDNAIWDAGEAMKRENAAASDAAGPTLGDEAALLRCIASQIEITPEFEGADASKIMVGLRSMSCRLEAAARELEELRADKDRLDWMQGVGIAAGKLSASPPIWIVTWDQGHLKSTTFRDVIDAAMSSAGRSEGDANG